MEPYDNNALMYKIALMVHFKTSLLVLKLLYRTAFFPLNCFYFLAHQHIAIIMPTKPQYMKKVTLIL